jgi:hypothetical protein
MHLHQSFARDGELYAMQASSRLHPQLATDVYLAHGSQDRYTVFSPLYVALIRALGLLPAEMLLYVACTAWFIAAAWALAREIGGREAAWLAAAAVICLPGFYGAYSIFRYQENYLTARSMGEALAVTALVLHFRGLPRVALLVSVAALLIHPLMALPVVFLLLCLNLPLRRALWGAALAIVGTLVVAVAARAAHLPSGPLAILDPAWREVVLQRSQFLFLDYWYRSDWQMHLQTFLCLALFSIMLDDARVKRLCHGAMLVGAGGLAIAFIAGSVGPVAVLLQGQAWRWFWITSFTCILLLAPAVIRMWRDDKCGKLCAVLMVAAWTFPPLPAMPAIAGVVFLWCSRSRIDTRAARLLAYAAYALIAIILAWVLGNIWLLFTSPRAESSAESLLVDRVRSVFNLRITAVVLFWAGCRWLETVRSSWVPWVVSAALAGFLPLVLPTSLNRQEHDGSAAKIEEFADWRAAIPPASSVLTVPLRKGSAFTWFTLDRPGYLSVDQSSGVVFSRATAMEIRRRAQVLLPISDPDYEILNLLLRMDKDKDFKPEDTQRPLTREKLIAICGDPELGFVIAKEDFGFDAIRHRHPGEFKDWNLYDCRRIRSGTPAA